MNKKKLILCLIVLILIGVVIYFIANNVSITKTTDEDYSNYTPEQEISDDQLNQTSITLYFLDKETNQIKSENHSINSSELLKNPYKAIVGKLLEGTNSENFESVFPENTRLIDANITNNCVILNFSDDLLKFKDDTQKYNIINVLLNTLTQLNEVTSIRILVNNEPVQGLNEEYSSIS